MPTPMQVNRLAALEARTPSATQDTWPPTRIRAAIQDLLTAVDGGYQEGDPLHCWAGTASDEELVDWWCGRTWRRAG